MKKIYEKTKKFIKNNIKVIILYAVLIAVFTVPLDYEIYTPGGLIKLSDRLDVEGYEEKGDFNLTYVGGKKGTIPLLLLSYIIPNWDIVSVDEMRIGEEEYTDIVKRGQIDLASVNQNALIVAFEEAGYEYKINKEEIAVYYIFEEATTDLKVGDIITHINGVKVNSLEELKRKIIEYEVGEEVSFTVLRNDKEEKCSGVIYESEGEKIIGIYLHSILDVETTPKVTFNYKTNENGSSGGLMSTLQIYNTLINEDITKGDVIAGTGTIELDGTVGEISGIKYKLIGAVKNGADVFIAPTNNYEEALKVKEENNYDIEIIEATTFKEVVEKLKNR